MAEEDLHGEGEADLVVEVTIEEAATTVASLLEVVIVEDTVVDPGDTPLTDGAPTCEVAKFPGKLPMSANRST